LILPCVQNALSCFGLAGYRTSVFADAEAFLAAWKEDWAGCVIADVRCQGRAALSSGELRDAK
jgi:FixJ family two-component response regulator